MPTSTLRVKIAKNQVFAPVLDWVLSETKLRPDPSGAFWWKFISWAIFKLAQQGFRVPSDAL